MTGANPLKVQRLGKLTGGEVCVCVGNCTLDGEREGEETSSGNCLWFGTTRLRVEGCGSVGDKR